jgi:branched-chain amino acid transport system ATP-binding protein
VFETTQQVNALGTTVLMVEQNVRFGLQLADHGVVMERGQVLISQPADVLLGRSDMASMFFGAGPTEPAVDVTGGRA